jgi:TDG/mug DNA glycosylase family protein
MIGFQTVVDWMGDAVLTLRDLWPEHPRAMIVGLNPAPKSVSLGHYYQGAVGRRQLGRLSAAGLFPLSDDGFFEANALAAGAGFTDIVKRPTTGERAVSRAEIEYGRARLLDDLAGREVPLLVCVFRHPVGVLLGTEGSPGMQSVPTSWGARVFRMPGPFAPAVEADLVMTELTRTLNL